MANKRRGPGKPFTKDDPRRSKGGRPKKSVSWKEAEDVLRQALPLVMLLKRDELEEALADNPVGALQLAADFVKESPQKAVERFLGKMPQILTGAAGAPLVPSAPSTILPPMNFDGWKPEQIDRYIEATSTAARGLAAPAPVAKPT